jgi:hypothetical protein
MQIRQTFIQAKKVEMPKANRPKKLKLNFDVSCCDVNGLIGVKETFQKGFG